MRRIDLPVDHFAGSLRIMAHFLLKSDNPHIFSFIRAIVDTGSPTTLIGPSDIKRMRLSKIQLGRLEGREKPINVGGGKIYTRVIEDAEIKIRGFDIKMPVDIPIRNEEQGTQPSLLGVDFMLKTKAKLFFYPINKKAYFEID